MTGLEMRSIHVPWQDRMSGYCVVYYLDEMVLVSWHGVCSRRAVDMEGSK